MPELLSSSIAVREEEGVKLATRLDSVLAT